MKWTEIPAGRVQAATQRFWVALGEDAETVARRIIGDTGYIERLAAFAKNPPFADKTVTSLNPQWLRAREIMGQNFFGIEEAMQHLGVRPKQEQIEVLSRIPFTEEILQACRKTHVLTAIFPLSIQEIQGYVRSELFSIRRHELDDESFASDKGSVGWCLFSKKQVLHSSRKSWEEQQGLLKLDEETPTARIMVYTIIGHFLSTGECLFERSYLRCLDHKRNGKRVTVGSFSTHDRFSGLGIGQSDDARGAIYLGLASIKKVC